MSNNDPAHLQLTAGVDATAAKDGLREIADAAGDMARSVSQSGEQAADGVAAVGDGAQGAAGNLSRAERSMVASIERATAAMRAGGKAGSEYYEILARQRGLSGDVLQPYIDKLREAEDAQRKLAESGAMSERAHAAAMRNVPAQITDIVVSLQGGMSPLTVMMQQGGQLRDMFNGVIPAIQALGQGVMGLASPLTITAAAVAALGVAYYQGSKEADAYAQAIIMTGNAAGVSIDQLSDMAAVLDGKGFTEYAAAAALAQIAATGYVAADSLEKVAQATLLMEKEAGIAVEQTVNAFAELGKNPLEASIKLNEAHRYLTLEIYEQIKALQEQGRETEAATLAQHAFADASIDRTTQVQERLGSLETAWRAITAAVREAKDEILAIGRPTTIEDQLAKAQKQLHSGPGWLQSRQSWAAEQQRLLDTITDKSGQILDRDAAAQKKAEDTRNQQQAIKASQALEKLENASLPDAQRRAKQLEQQLFDVALAAEKIARVNPEDPRLANIGKIQQGLMDNAKPKGRSTGGGGGSRAAHRVDLSDIQSAARYENALLEQQQRELDQRRQAGLLAEADYYAKKRQLIEQSSGVEKQALQEQIDRLNSSKKSAESSKQIRETRIKLALHEIETKNKLAQVDQDAIAAAARQEAALQSLATTHARYLEQLQTQMQRSIGTAWMGTKERQRMEGQWAIEDRYLSEQRRLEDQRMFTVGMTPEQNDQIEMRLQLLETEKQRKLALYRDEYQQLDIMQAQWILGAGQAMQEYVDQAASVAGKTADLFTSAFQGMEDALTEFAMTGKADFEGLAKSIVAGLIRIQIQASLMRTLDGSGWLGHILSGFGIKPPTSTSSSPGNAGQGLMAPGNAGQGLMAPGNAGQGLMAGWADGGYTGDGGKHEPAGIVHRGEFVINAASTRRLGVGYLNALNGYANGGAVGGSGVGQSAVARVEIINNGQPAQVQGAHMSRDIDGSNVLHIVINGAVSEVAGQLASDSGPVGLAMRQRAKMRM